MKVDGKHMRSIWLKPDGWSVGVIDQTVLPHRFATVRLATLEDVIDFYDGGGRANPKLDSDIRPLHLTADEKREIIAFLRSLVPAYAKQLRHAVVQTRIAATLSGWSAIRP